MAQEPVKKLFLFDALSLIFRAFYAPMQAPLVSPKGMPTQAIYIFIRTLRKLLREHRPDYVAAAFDLAAPTFRDALFQSYKANRPSFPEDLAVQMPYVRRFCQAMGLSIVEKEGYEADDLMGTLARRAAGNGCDVVLVSGDEDLFQLVDERITVLKPPRSAKERDEENIFDAKKVEESLGVGPAQVVDWIALTGDPSDNIPGARPLPGQEPAAGPGAKKRSYIGPKGATELIRQFGSVEGALEHWSEASRQSYRDALRDFRKEALLSKQLATIHTTVPIDVAPESLAPGEPDAASLASLCQELGFTSLLREFMAEAKPAVAPVPDNVEQLDTPEAAAEWLQHLPAGARIAIATPVEGGEITPPRLMALGLADGSRAAAIPLAMNPRRAGVLASLAKALEAGRHEIAAHDAKLFRRLLGREGVYNIPPVAFDTLLHSFLLDPLATSHALPDVLLRAQGKSLADSPAQAAVEIFALAEAQSQEMKRHNLIQVYSEIELPLAEVLADIETAGVLIDPEILGALSREFDAGLAALTESVYELAGGPFDIDSPKQLGDILFEKLKLPGGKKLKKSGQYSTVASVLETLAEQHELPRKILEYRTRAKLKSTYVDALPRFILPETGRVHTTFNAAGSRTGRLSSSNPNLQNIPVDDQYGALIRSAFVAAPGWKLIAADYSQIELRVLAHLSEDPLLIEAFSRDEDIHSQTAQILFGVLPALQTREHRRMAKAINYGVIYGLSAFGLSQRTGTSKAEAQRYIDEYFNRYKKVNDFLQACVEQARVSGEVRTLFGRARPIPEIHSSDFNARGRAEREAMNTPLQGTAADLMKLAMVKLHSRLRRDALQARIILTVHDELVLEAPESELDRAQTAAREAMETVIALRVPLKVEMGAGANWRDAK